MLNPASACCSASPARAAAKAARYTPPASAHLLAAADSPQSEPPQHCVHLEPALAARPQLPATGHDSAAGPSSSESMLSAPHTPPPDRSPAPAVSRATASAPVTSTPHADSSPPAHGPVATPADLSSPIASILAGKARHTHPGKTPRRPGKSPALPSPASLSSPLYSAAVRSHESAPGHSHATSTPAARPASPLESPACCTNG